MAKSGSEKIMRWEMQFYEVKDNGIQVPVLLWKCFIGERMEVGSIMATPKLKLVFKSEFNDNAFQIESIEQAEMILNKFGLEKPKLIDVAINDLLILENQYIGNIDDVIHEYNKLSNKWGNYVPKH